MWTSVLYRYEHTYLQKAGISKIMQLLWTVVTYLLEKNVEHKTEHDIDSTFGVCIH